jgi:hypothetical protein
MSDDDLRRDMREMRAQLAESSAARKAATPAPTRASPPEETAREPDLPEDTSEEDVTRLQSELDKLLESLDNELSEIPTATAVGIFALGVLLGRLLPR